MHEVADLNGGHAGAPANRRPDGAIADLDVEILELRGIGIHRGAPDIDLSARVLQRDQCGCVFGEKLGVARDVAFRLLEVRFGAGEQAFNLSRLRFDGTAVEGEQEVALVHHCAVAEVHAGDLAIHARFHRDAGNRCHRSKRLDAHGNDLLGGGHDFDRDRAGRVLAGSLRNGAARPQTATCGGDGAAGCDQHHHCPRHQDPLLHYRAAAGP